MERHIEQAESELVSMRSRTDATNVVSRSRASLERESAGDGGSRD